MTYTRTILRLATLLLFLFMLAAMVPSNAWAFFSDAGEWVPVGSEGFGANATELNSIAFNPLTHEPYVAFLESTDATRLLVVRFDGSSWVPVGSEVSKSPYWPSLVFNQRTNEPYVAYIDGLNGDRFVVKRFDGVSWVPVGSVNPSTGRAWGLTLAFNPRTDEPYVAYVDLQNGSKLTVMRFDGASWIPVGLAEFSAGNPERNSLAFSPVTNEPYLAYNDAANGNRVSVIKFDGSSWVHVGQAGFSSYVVAVSDFAFNPLTNEPYVVFSDQSKLGRATVMRFDGSEWKFVGSAGFSNGEVVVPRIAFGSATTSEPYVAYADGADNNKATAMRFNGSVWVQVGSSGFSTGGAIWPDFAFNPFTNEPYVVYGDSVNSKGMVMKFSTTEPAPVPDDDSCSMIDLSMDSPISYAQAIASKKNLVVITHGWVNSADDPYAIEMMNTMRNNICNAIDRKTTTVLTYDWRIGAGTGNGVGGALLGTQFVAYENAAAAGSNLATDIHFFKTAPTHIHFIAHSAGSNVIQHAVYNIARVHGFQSTTTPDGRTAPTVHLTFLDAFAPNKDSLGVPDGLENYAPKGVEQDYGNLYGLSGYAEQYVDTRPLFGVVGDVKAPDYTDIQLANATNFEVGALDPQQLIYDTGHPHMWPVDFYNKSITDSSYNNLGFSFSMEKAPRIPFPFNLKGAKCYVTNVNDPYHSCLNNQLELFIQRSGDAVIGISNTVISTVQTGVDLGIDVGAATINGVTKAVTGTAEVVAKGTVDTVTGVAGMAGEALMWLWPGSPSWIQFDITTKESVNAIQFDYLFPSPLHDTTFAVFVDGTRVFLRNTSMAEGNHAYHEQMKLPETLKEGPHTIIFRIDPLTEEHTGVYISDVRLGLQIGTEDVGLIDTTAPTTTHSFSGMGGPDWFRSDALVTLTATDTPDGLGVASTTYSLDNGATWLNYSAPFTITGEGTHTVQYHSFDNAGNVEDVKTAEVKIDITAPTITIDTLKDTYMKDEVMNFTYADNLSGIASTSATLDGNLTATDTLMLTATGSHTIILTAEDNAGNITQKSHTFVVESPAPIITDEASSSTATSSVTITWTTDHNVTSRVVYDTVSHATVGAAPNYGYANTTTEDSTMVTSHGVVVGGLAAGTTYYARAVSHGSPEAVSNEMVLQTLADTGSLVVSKNTLGGNGTFNFIGDAGAFSITTIGGVGSTTVASLQAGTYAITETPLAGWTVATSDCAQITIVPGEVTRCTITNAKQGNIIVKKVVSDAGTTATFPFLASYKLDGFSIAGGSQDDSGLLNPDTYAVSEDVPDGWTLASSTCSDGSDPSAIVLDPGETVTCTFTNVKKVDTNTGSISGMKFEDKNGNGKKDADERRLFGWVIYIDANNDGKLSRGERFTITNRNGEYRLRRLPAGTYSVKEVIYKGWGQWGQSWMQTFPSGGVQTVKLSIGQTITGKDFGNFKKGKIGGIIFEDANGNGKMDKKERPLRDWTVTLTLSGGTTKTIVTDRNGSYSFNDLGPGTYTVREIAKTGWKQTTPNPGSIVGISGFSMGNINIGNKADVKIESKKDPKDTGGKNNGGRGRQ